MHIDYLINHESLIPELARMHFAEWGYLRAEETLEGRTARLRSCCGRHAIPTVVVALSGSTPCGSAMLVQHDMATRPDLTPWLAGVYVAPACRERGYGSELVGRIEEEAASLGAPSLHLYTTNAESFYARRGWTVLERCEYLGERVTIMTKWLVV